MKFSVGFGSLNWTHRHTHTHTHTHTRTHTSRWSLMRPKTTDKLFGASCFYYYSFSFSNTSWSHTHTSRTMTAAEHRQRERCVRNEIALGEFSLFAYTVFHGSGFQVTHKHMVSISQEQSHEIRSLNSRQGVKSASLH